LLRQPPYSPDLTLVGFFFFRRVKEELAGVRSTPETIKKDWEGVMQSITMEEFTVTFRRWLDCCKKCIRINGGYVEKS
jgi:hypothetical protein